MKLNEKELISYQKFWKESEVLSERRKTALIALSNVFLEQAKSNNYEIDNIKLFYPEDCSNWESFTDFALVMQAHITLRDDGKAGGMMKGWFLNKEVDVE